MSCDALKALVEKKGPCNIILEFAVEYPVFGINDSVGFLSGDPIEDVDNDNDLEVPILFTYIRYIFKPL